MNIQRKRQSIDSQRTEYVLVNHKSTFFYPFLSQLKQHFSFPKTAPGVCTFLKCRLIVSASSLQGNEAFAKWWQVFHRGLCASKDNILNASTVTVLTMKQWSGYPAIWCNCFHVVQMFHCRQRSLLKPGNSNVDAKLIFFHIKASFYQSHGHDLHDFCAVRTVTYILGKKKLEQIHKSK